MDNTAAFISYLNSGRLPRGFLGLDSAPANNSLFYTARERFARWAAKNCAAGGRSVIRSREIFTRLGTAAASRGADKSMLNPLVSICLLESSGTNAGFGRDRFGSSLAVGPMQTKWSAVMDGGSPYEGYLDIVTDRNSLVGVDAGVGYFLRFAKRFPLLDAVAKYNDPRTSSATNEHYLKAYNMASRAVLYTTALGEAEESYMEFQKWLTSSSSSREGPI
jgi:hypothetical protein